MQVPKAVKDVYKMGKNTVLQVPEIERRVKEATSNEKWGPSGTQMRDIAQATHSYNDLPAIMQTIWRRLNDHGKYWRHVYKSLLLIDYLLKNGAEQVVRECRSNVIQIQTLTEFQHIDENDKDVGLSVRERAKLIVELLHDDKRLRNEREKARSNAKKYLVGIGSEVGGAGGGGGYGNESFGSGGGGGGGYGGGEGYRDNDDDWNKKGDSYHDEPDNSYEEPNRSNGSGSNNGSGSGNTGGRPRAPSFDRSPAASGAPSGGSSRPRAPSFEGNNGGNATTSNAPRAAPAPAVNLFDLDDVPAPAANRASEFNFFNAPSTGGFGAPAPAPAQSNNGFGAFSSAPAPSNNSGFDSGFGSGFSSAPPASNNTFTFDPRNTSSIPPQSNNAFPASTSSSSFGAPANDAWADFQGSGTGATSTEPQPAKKDDLWSQAANLIGNLDLSNKPASSQSSGSKAPMGAIGSSKPMGKPTGPNTPITPTPMASGFGAPVAAPVTGPNYNLGGAAPVGYGAPVGPNYGGLAPQPNYGGAPGVRPMTMGGAPAPVGYGAPQPGYGGYGMPQQQPPQSSAFGAQPSYVNPAALGRGQPQQQPPQSNQGWGF